MTMINYIDNTSKGDIVLASWVKYISLGQPSTHDLALEYELGS